QSDPFPVLTVPTTVTSPPQNTGNVVHPLTQVGVTPTVNGRQTQPVVVVTQPPPVPISVPYLRDSPGLVRCPYCHHTVTTKSTFTASTKLKLRVLTLHVCVCFRLICGFCLIPLMVHGLQDAHHSCPQCGNQLHVYTR
uniref:LITAF domain-containing protein n=1 Tax=Lates calcarifer TaxID=8187 RepID=A0A4W6ETE0_LATCA